MSEELSVNENGEEAEPQVPWYEQTWKRTVRGEVVEVPVTTTIREIKERLPQGLLEEFIESIENTAGYMLRHRIAEWGMPPDKIVDLRLEIDEVEARMDAGDYTGITTFSSKAPVGDELHGDATVVTSAEDGHKLRESGYEGHIWVNHGDDEETRARE